MDRTLYEILLIFLLLIANGVFAMTEIAMVSTRKVRIEQRAENGDPQARTLLSMLGQPNRFLSTIQIVISLVGVFAGALGGATLAVRLGNWLATFERLQPYSQGLALVTVALLTTYFSLVIGELIPKRLGLNNPERISLTMARPMQVLSAMATPVVRLLGASTDLGLRLLGAKPSTEPPITQEEIQVLIEQGTRIGVLEEAEQDMLEGVFRMGERFIDAILTPRTEIEWIDMDEPLEEIKQQVLASRFSYFPVSRGSLDNVIGILATRDLLAQMITHEAVNIQSLVQAPLFVPDSMSVLRVLDRMKQHGVQIVLVLDEYGGLLGMATLYDILTAIVGHIPQGGEGYEQEIVQREDGSYLVDGLVSIDELKDLLDIDELPEEARIGYQTLGGFIMSRTGAIPVVGDTFEWNAFRFEVVDMDERRVDKVLISRVPPTQPMSDDQNQPTIET